MSEAVTATYVFDETQWKTAQRIYRRDWKHRAAPILIGISSLTCIVAGILLTRSEHPMRATASGLIAYGFMLPLLRFWRLRKELSLFRKSSSYGIKSVVTFENNRLKATSDRGTVDLALNSFIAATFAPEGFLLFQHARYFIWLPSSGFASPEDFAKACERVKANVKKVKDRR